MCVLRTLYLCLSCVYQSVRPPPQGSDHLFGLICTSPASSLIYAISSPSMISPITVNFTMLVLVWKVTVICKEGSVVDSAHLPEELRCSQFQLRLTGVRHINVSRSHREHVSLLIKAFNFNLTSCYSVYFVYINFECSYCVMWGDFVFIRHQVFLRSVHVRKRGSNLRADGSDGVRSENVSVAANPCSRCFVSFGPSHAAVSPLCLQLAASDHTVC